MRKIRDNIKVNNSPQDDLINQIIDIEWDMFDQVNNQGQRADCQDDEWTFYVMRYSQFSMYTFGELSLYMNDLMAARNENRNMIAEKYAYMMEYTDKAYFDAYLKPRIPAVSERKKELACAIADLLVECHMEFSLVYPSLSDAGRPEAGTDGSMVSMQIYSIGEFETCSEMTLEALYKNFRKRAEHGENLARTILSKTVELYGYESLEEAEIKMRRK